MATAPSLTIFDTSAIGDVCKDADDCTTAVHGGCECGADGCGSAGRCTCVARSGDASDANYTVDGKLVVAGGGNGIFECNALCSCAAPACSNRVLQKFRADAVPLEKFDTGIIGYGVRATSPIPAGTMVAEYTGELISLAEAKVRLARLPPGEPNYVLVIREYLPSKQLVTCWDASATDNLAKFVNHSCDPNVQLVPVRVNSLQPRVGMFASRDIAVHEALGFDYGEGQGADVTASGVECHCGAASCRKFLPSNMTAV